jgi:hypothetical protein
MQRRHDARSFRAGAEQEGGNGVASLNCCPLDLSFIGMSEPDVSPPYGPWRPCYPRPAGAQLFDVYLETVRGEYRAGVMRAIHALMASSLHDIAKLVNGVLGGGVPGLIATARTIEEALRIKKHVEAGKWTGLQQRVTSTGRISTRSGDLEMMQFPDQPAGEETCCTVILRECKRSD